MSKSFIRYQKLFKIAQDNATPLEEIVKLYGKVSQSQADLGISSAQLVKFTENVAKSLRVGGKSAGHMLVAKKILKKNIASWFRCFQLDKNTHLFLNFLSGD